MKFTFLQGHDESGQQLSDDSGFSRGKIFIGGLPTETTDFDLKNYFVRFGVLADVVVMKDKITGNGRGFGFVTFEDPQVFDLLHPMSGVGVGVGWVSSCSCCFASLRNRKATILFNSILAPVAEKVVAQRHTIRGRSVGQIDIVTLSTTVQFGVELKENLDQAN
eukprot:752123-Hanusia_phi.AAC.3